MKVKKDGKFYKTEEDIPLSSFQTLNSPWQYTDVEVYTALHL